MEPVIELTPLLLAVPAPLPLAEEWYEELLADPPNRAAPVEVPFLGKVPYRCMVLWLPLPLVVVKGLGLALEWLWLLPLPLPKPLLPNSVLPKLRVSELAPETAPNPVPDPPPIPDLLLLLPEFLVSLV